MVEGLQGVGEPVVLRGCVDWAVCSRPLDELASLTEDSLPFRQGRSRCQTEPHWERSCSVSHMTLAEFLKKADLDDAWYYFDYKHLAHWFTRSPLLQDVDWKGVGLPGRGLADSTIWIGSKGAHTPCHYDSYGCNFVAQVHGRKEWVLFPPGEAASLRPTRVPYEESSVYSDINFACGCSSPKLKGVTRAKVVTLEPRDVLFVPKHWWHYVENLTTAVSINTWLPLESDKESRLEESLVKNVMACLLAGQPDLRPHLLNPNEDDLEPRLNVTEVAWCAEEARGACQPTSEDKGPWSELPWLPGASLSALLRAKCRGRAVDSPSSALPHTTRALVNALCHPDTIATARRALLRTLQTTPP